MKTRNKTTYNVQLAQELQRLMHNYGADEFITSLTQALYNASDDTEDFDDKSLCQQYRYLAGGIQDLNEDTPEFDNVSYREEYIGQN